MKKQRFTLLLSLAASLLYLFSPFAVLADAAGSDTPAAQAPVIITEFQTRGTTVAQEFIELYNTTAQPIALDGWAIWYLPAANGPDKLSAGNIIPLQANNSGASGVPADGSGSAASSSPTVIPAHGYYVLSGGGAFAAADQTYTASQGLLADSGGNLWLVSPGTSACTFIPQDEVGWGSATHSAGTPIKAPAANQSAERLLNAQGQYIDSGQNASDFGLSSTASPPTPGMPNNLLAPANTPAGTAPIYTQVTDPTCMPPAPPATGSSVGDSTDTTSTSDSSSQLAPADASGPPATITSNPSTDASSSQSSSPQMQTTSISSLPPADVGLISPQLTELLPNPAPPQTDAHDEFIELYNPNPVTFDLSGFRLAAGLNATHSFTFPAGTTLAAQSFTAFFASDTKLALSNGGGQVTLLDPTGDTISQTAAYGAAKEGQAWALANGTWYWSTNPTPNAANVITAPAAPARTAKTSSSATSATKSAKTSASTKPAKASPSNAAKKTAALASAPASQLDASLQPTPINPGILATIACFAILYGAYEYRRDVANKLYQLRVYRSARRENRPSPKGG